MIRVWVVVLVGLAASCTKSGEAIVAKLDHTTAQVERMPRAAAPWQPAKVGDTFVIGSGVRTGAASHAKLRVGKNGKLDVEASSVVYFTRTPGRARDDLRVEAGTVELETGDETVGIGIGEAVLDPNTRARIESGPDGTTLLVTVGRAVLEDGEIAAGQRVTLGPGGAKVARAEVDAGVSGLAAPSDGSTAVAVRDKPAQIDDGAGKRELPVGEHAIASGASLVVPGGSTVEIARGGGRLITAGPSALRLGNGALLADVTSGSVTLHGETAPASATVKGGTVTARAGADTALFVDGKNTAIDAQAGTTDVSSKSGTRTLEAGQSAVLNQSGELTVAPPAPERTVVTIAAGESPTLHDVRAPTPIRIVFDQACPRSGVVEVAKDRAFKKLLARSGGARSANVLVPAGSYSYRVRCPGARGPVGTLRVVKDSGRNPLPAAAARTTVEMDGREYTVLYQNVLPELTLAWRKPAKASTYTFVITPARGTPKRLVNTSPTLKLLPGELREGSYKVWVEPASGTRSEEARVVIQFDNAAQSASIDHVDNAGGTLEVKGTVIEGSTVTAGSAAVQLDRQRRFSAEIVPGEREDGAAVRIAHPRAGIHYYVMRTAPP